MARIQLRFVTAIVILLYLAADIFFSPTGWLECEAESWWQFDWVACGVILCQPVLLAIWTTLAAQPLAARLPPALQLSGLACVLLAWGGALNLGQRQTGQAVSSAILWLLIFAGAVLPALTARWCGWRIECCDDACVTARRAFSLRQLFAWVFQAAIVFAALRWLDGPLTGLSAAEMAESFLAIGCMIGIGCFVAAAVMPLLWLALSNRRQSLLKAIAALFMLTTATSAGLATCWLLDLIEGPNEFSAVSIGVIASVGVTFSVLQASGFTMARRRDVDKRSVRLFAAGSQTILRWRFAVVLSPLIALTVGLLLVAPQRIDEWRTAAVYGYWQSLGWRAQVDEGRVIGLAAIRPETLSDARPPIVLNQSQLAPLVGQTDLAMLTLKSFKLEAAQIWYLKKAPNLRTLVLDNGDISDTACADWGELAALTSLSLEDCCVSDDALISVARAPHLRELHLKRTNIGDRGIAALADCRELAFIDLLFTEVTLSGVEQLASSLPRAVIYATSTDSSLALDPVPRARLQVIRSSSPQGLVDLLRALSQARWFYANGGDADDSSVALLQSHERLEYLTLAGAKITDGVVAHAKTLTGLKRLDLRRTQVTDAGLVRLRMALPQCEILR